MAVCFKIAENDIILTEEDDELYRSNSFCRVCDNEFLIDKVQDHCHLIGKYRGPARSNCNINIPQKQSNFIPIVFHNFSNYDSHMFFNKMNYKKNDKVNFDIISYTDMKASIGCSEHIRLISTKNCFKSVRV